MKNALWTTSFLVVLVLGLGACTTNVEEGVTGRDELGFNHDVLRIFYLYQEELQPLNAYIGGGEGNGTWGDVLAMYDGLSDPYTHYFTPEQAEETRNAYLSSGTSDGLMGLQVGWQDKADSTQIDTLEVVRVLPGSPAQAGGLLSGDKVLEVQGVDVTGPLGDSLFFVHSKGDSGVVITLKMLRGDSLWTQSVMKSVFPIPTVYLDRVDGIPVIQITQFSAYSLNDSGTAAEFHAALREVQDAPAVVVDVRGNPGGSVDECLDVSDQFVSSGNMIVEIRREYDERSNAGYFDTTDFPARTGDLGESMYLVALADGGSASCSEIFLAAVTANLGTKVVGTQSYGKGIGQNLFDTPAGGLSVVTSLQFRDAFLVDYHGEGIPADYSTGSEEGDLALAVRMAATRGDTTLAMTGGNGLARAAVGGLSTGTSEKIRNLQRRLNSVVVEKAPLAVRQDRTVRHDR